MQIIPVLDILDGNVVRGVAGRRDEYQPVESVLAAGANPLDIARGYRDALGLKRLYLADLDAIMQGRPNRKLWKKLVDDGFEILVDAGVKTIADAQQVYASGATAAIVALETSPSRELLAELCTQYGPPRVIFSLDLKQGRPLGTLDQWQNPAPFDLAVEAVSLGVEQMIVLDLAWVGTGEGLATEELCRRLLERFTQLQVITGGGIRGPGDLPVVQATGVHGLLVASALHSGRIDRAALDAWRA
ncbi:HisA/HisF-related TIM barrel protein [Symmachiella dynata]|uniref:HisA/HisF-related TIM barrel protein n=1 Tax=Symmachiella dynata TaxID=2527995 RepID=UPI0030EF9BCE